MKNRILFCATVDYHFHAFHLPYLKWFKEQGWEVHVAASGDMNLPFVDKKYNIPIQRSPFKKQNVVAYQQLKAIIRQNQYSIMHCHTPMGGVLARLAANSFRKGGTRVIYTAHGFHFCKGAPLINWLIYYPIEKILSRFTDCLITINQEDYQLARNKRFKAKLIKHVHGVGVNTDLFKPVTNEEKNRIREKYGYNPNDFLMFYAAEFNKNKNQKLLIKSLASIKNKIPNAKLLLAGEGPLIKACKELAARLEVQNMVDFLGFRKDIRELLNMSDIGVASSLREGLPVNIMETMASGLPVVASRNRGHVELITHNINGWLIDHDNLDEFALKLTMGVNDRDCILVLGEKAREKMLAQYSINKVLEDMTTIYSQYMEEKEEMRWAVQ
ncbi:glycosyltransferase family 4 protein [Bacillus sp. T3]|uniref:glycosyltransferase family 4 protein n=1 Tax=Bacillus sp. T3 TaxID=467262 RepID=UPI0029828AA5|nr:glycosyltransferase family 4 protein [Bacillus sp. T3]